MGSELRHCTIGDLCDSGFADLQTGPFGSQLHASDYADTGIAVVPTEAIRARRIDHSVLPRINEAKAHELRRHRLEAGDILFARRGAQATGRVALVRPSEEGFLCGTGAIRLRLGSEVCSDYVSHVLSSPATHAWLRTHAIGATMPNLNKAVIRSVPLSLPPMAEQMAIASFLTSFDDKLELNRRMNGTLESIARATFKSWFVDFDPVSKKMEGKTGGELGLPPDLAGLFPDSLEDSLLGPVPKGWPVVPLSSMIDVNPKYRLPRGSDAPYVEMSGLPTDGARVLKSRTRSIASGSRFRNGDVLVARITPCLENGKTALVDFLEPDQTAWGSTEFLVLHANAPASVEFAYCLGRSAAFRDYAVGSMNGSSGRQRAPAVAIARFPTVCPPAKLLECFAQVVGSFVRLMAANDRGRELLSALRSVLLPELISGDRDLDAAQSALSAPGRL